jgi:3-oxoacyl-[acyl-carrier-protein] synthase III
MGASILAIDYHLPAAVVDNTELASAFPEWSAEQLEAKTGIVTRHIAAEKECASDLAFEAASTLLARVPFDRRKVDFLLLCTQSPDYFLPTTACLLQDRLGLPVTCGALDFNLGCSGFVYGLSLAKGLIESHQASAVLLLTAETYSKFMHPLDKSVQPIFGDGAAATLIVETPETGIGELVLGTDGRGWSNLIVPTGGTRNPTVVDAAAEADSQGSCRTVNNLYMNGPEIFAFTLQAVPSVVERLLAKARLTANQIDVFVFHQANKYMLEHLRKKLGIAPEKFVISMSHCGNTVSSTIPIALRDAEANGLLKSGSKVMVVGFGVGYSWGAGLLTWR